MIIIVIIMIMIMIIIMMTIITTAQVFRTYKNTNRCPPRGSSSKACSKP